MEKCLQILSESLDRKIEVLSDIQNYNKQQEKAFKESVPDMASFDQALEEKEVLIQRIERLDDGFETLYEKIADLLKTNKGMYVTQIKEIQDKIRKVTDMSVQIQEQEANNKKLIEKYFANERNVIKQGRQGSKVAYDYYRNMSGVAFSKSQFMDSKK